MRNQVLNVCEKQPHSAIYEAGSIETLVKIVDKNGGYTIIPELHTSLLSDVQRNNLRPIVRPETNREISIVVRQDYIREGMMNMVAEAVKKLIPGHMIDPRLKKFAIRAINLLSNRILVLQFSAQHGGDDHSHLFPVQRQ